MSEKFTWTHKLFITKVVDGDTIKADVDLGHDVELSNQTIRLVGIDTPEKTGPGKELGLAVSAIIKKLIPKLVKDNNGIVWFRSTAKKDSFGRMIGEVYFGSNKESLNTLLIRLGLAKLYEPGLFREGVKFEKTLILNEIAKLKPFVEDTTGKIAMPELKIATIVDPNAKVIKTKKTTVTNTK